MLKKLRTKPLKLEIFESLNTRMNLLSQDKQNYINLKKGFEGEVMFDSLTEKLNCDCYILNDLRLMFNNSVFQIDTLIIFQKIIRVFEVKNYEGDFFYEEDKLYIKNKTEIKDPLLQLKRSESLLRQLFQRLGYSIPIEGSVIFINPEFTLYQAPLDAPIIFPTQLNRYMKKLYTTPSKLNGMHERLADRLVSLHIEESPYERLPAYDYPRLKKGFTCKVCHSFFIIVVGNKCICGQCNHEEHVDSAVLRHVREFKLLFPDRKVTTNGIFEWCGGIDSKKRINRILVKNFKSVGAGQWTFYE
jgi:hypothetical protein